MYDAPAGVQDISDRGSAEKSKEKEKAQSPILSAVRQGGDIGCVSYLVRQTSGPDENAGLRTRASTVADVVLWSDGTK